jgi:hypothetical protein
VVYLSIVDEASIVCDTVLDLLHDTLPAYLLAYLLAYSMHAFCPGDVLAQNA